MTALGPARAAWYSRGGMPSRRRRSWALAQVLLGAVAGCTGVSDIPIGADARDGGFDVPLPPVDSGLPRLEVDTGVVPLPTDVGMPSPTDVGTPLPTDVGTPSPTDAGMMGPPVCMTTAECTMACPPGSRGCVCAATMMGLRCVPTCMINPECPPGPSGVVLMCRMGLCVP